MIHEYSHSWSRLKNRYCFLHWVFSLMKLELYCLSAFAYVTGEQTTDFNSLTSNVMIIITYSIIVVIIYLYHCDFGIPWFLSLVVNPTTVSTESVWWVCCHVNVYFKICHATHTLHSAVHCNSYECSMPFHETKWKRFSCNNTQ